MQYCHSFKFDLLSIWVRCSNSHYSLRVKLSFRLLFSTFLEWSLSLFYTHSATFAENRCMYLWMLRHFPFISLCCLTFSTSFCCFFASLVRFLHGLGAISVAILLYLLAHSLFVSFRFFGESAFGNSATNFLPIFSHSLSPLPVALAWFHSHSRFRFRAL